MDRHYNSLSAWEKFKAQMHEPDVVGSCQFCGIRHVYGETHPHCDMATRFKRWCDAGMPVIRKRRSQVV